MQPLGVVVGGDTRVEKSKSSWGFSREESIPVVFVPLVEGLLLEDKRELLSRALYDVFRFVPIEQDVVVVAVAVADIFVGVSFSFVDERPFPVDDAPFIRGTIMVLA